MKSPSARKRKTVIVGDSIVNGLQQHKLARAAKQDVTVKFFPGSTVGDMSDYVKPILRESQTILFYMWEQMIPPKEKRPKL